MDYRHRPLFIDVEVVRGRVDLPRLGQRQFFFDHGYLALQGYVGERWIARLRSAMDELIDASRARTASDDVYTLEEGHSAATPRGATSTSGGSS